MPISEKRTRDRAGDSPVRSECVLYPEMSDYEPKFWSSSVMPSICTSKYGAERLPDSLK